MSFQGTEQQGQHPLRDVRQQAAQSIEATGLVLEVEEDQWGSLAANHVQSGGHGTVLDIIHDSLGAV